MKTIVRFAVLAGMLAAPLAEATLYNDAGAGNWNATTTWTAGTGYPQAGDGIYLDTAGTIVVTQDEEFGGVGITSDWKNTGGNLQINNGVTLTHLAGGSFNLYVQNNQLLGGGTSGRFLNQGTIQQTYFYRDLELLNGITLENQGTYRFPTSPSSTWACLSIDAGSTFFSNGGVIDVDTPFCALAGVVSGNAGTFTTWNGTSHAGLTIDIASGASLMIGENYFGKTGLRGKVQISDLKVASTGALRISGGSSPDFSGDFTADGKLEVRNDGVFNLGNDVTMNFGAGMIWNAATIDLKGHTLTSLSNISQQGTEDNNITLTDSVGGGRFVNRGIFTHNKEWRGLNLVNNAVFENAGTFQSVIRDDAVINLGAGSVFRNLAGGALEFKSGNAVAGYNNVTGSGTFDNLGAYIVSNGTDSRVGGTTSISQYSGSALTGGTWKSTGAGSRMNLKFNGRGDIATIGANATVILENGGTIDAINSALSTVNGTFLVNGSSTFIDASGFTVGGTGRLGGSGTITGGSTVLVQGGGTVLPGASPGTLTVPNLTLAAGANYLWESGDLIAATGALNLTGGTWNLYLDSHGRGWQVSPGTTIPLFRYGTLTATAQNPQVYLDGVAYGLTALIDDNAGGLFLSGLSVVPEPSTLLLLAMGGWLVWRARRRNGKWEMGNG